MRVTRKNESGFDVDVEEEVLFFAHTAAPFEKYADRENLKDMGWKEPSNMILACRTYDWVRTAFEKTEVPFIKSMIVSMGSQLRIFLQALLNELERQEEIDSMYLRLLMTSLRQVEPYGLKPTLPKNVAEAMVLIRLEQA